MLKTNEIDLNNQKNDNNFIKAQKRKNEMQMIK